MEVPTQRKCVFIGKAPKVSKLQKPQPRKQATSSGIEDIQNIVLSNNTNNLLTSLPKTSENDVKIPEITDLSNNRLCCHDYNVNVQKSRDTNSPSVLSNIQNQYTDINSNHVVENPDKVKRNLAEALSQSVRKRAPRGNKLVRPPPMKSKAPQTQNAEALETQLLNYVEKLLDDSLSLHCTFLFRDFVSKNGAQMEATSQDLMDKCFDCIQEAITRNALDSIILINLQNILILRQQDWQSQLQDQPLDSTWRDIMDESSSSSSSIDEDRPVHLILTQQSTDSGFGDMDEVLWDCEEEFHKDLQELNSYSRKRLEDIPEAEYQDKKVQMDKVTEALVRLTDTSSNHHAVQETSNTPRTFRYGKKSPSPTPIKSYTPPPPPASQSEPCSPTSPSVTDYMPPLPPQLRLQRSSQSPESDQWYLPPPPPSAEQSPRLQPIDIAQPDVWLVQSPPTTPSVKQSPRLLSVDMTQPLPSDGCCLRSPPTTPSVDQHKWPVRSTPTTPSVDQPKWPVRSTPTTPSVDQPKWPVRSTPTTPSVDQPKWPVRSTPTTPSVDQQKWPVRLNRQLSEEKQRVTVIREPIGAGTNPGLLEEMEKTMPSGKFTPKGRRAMFSCYRTAMGGFHWEPEPVCPDYSRDELLAYSDSHYAKISPPEWSYLEKIYPAVCLRKVDSYFDRKQYEEKIRSSEKLQMWQTLAKARITQESF